MSLQLQALGPPPGEAGEILRFPATPPIVSAYRANSDEVFSSIAKLYLPSGASVIDASYGRGHFWKLLRKSDYKLTKQDFLWGHDAANTGLKANGFDAFVFDPPFIRNAGSTYRKLPRFRENYNLASAVSLRTHEDLLRLYDRVSREAARVLKPKGRYILKAQDEVANGRQRLTHVELINRLGIHGLRIVDLFVLMQKSMPQVPTRNQRQKHARKNHSYFLVFEKVVRKRQPNPMVWD